MAYNLCPDVMERRRAGLPPPLVSYISLYSGSCTLKSSQFSTALNLIKYMLKSCYSPWELSIRLYALLKRVCLSSASESSLHPLLCTHRVQSTFISRSLRQASLYQVVTVCTEEKEERVVLRGEESCPFCIYENISPTAERTADVLLWDAFSLYSRHAPKKIMAAIPPRVLLYDPLSVIWNMDFTQRILGIAAPAVLER